MEVQSTVQERKEQVPVILLAGFLGSGKTSLLNHLLRNDAGVRVGVIVNDFGSVNIDAMLVAGQVDSMVAMSNGCLCCSVDDGELDTALDQLSQKRSAIDVIVVEASGLADPQTLSAMILRSPAKRIEFGGLIEVVDAGEFDNTTRQHPEILRRLVRADLIVVNKIDHVDQETLDQTAQLIKKVAPLVAVAGTSFGRVDPLLLLGEKALRGSARSGTRRRSSFPSGRASAESPSGETLDDKNDPPRTRGDCPGLPPESSGEIENDSNLLSAQLSLDDLMRSTPSIDLVNGVKDYGESGEFQEARLGSDYSRQDDHSHGVNRHDGHSHDGHSHDGRSHDGHSHDGHSHDGHSHDGHSHDGHSHDEHSHDGHSHDEHSYHLHDGYHAVTIDVSRPLHPRRLRKFVDSGHEGVFRAKGFVTLAVPDGVQTFEYQRVGHYPRFRPSPAGSHGGTRSGLDLGGIDLGGSQVVFVGTTVDEQKLADGLKACEVRPGEVLTADETWHLHPFLDVPDADEPEFYESGLTIGGYLLDPEEDETILP